MRRITLPDRVLGKPRTNCKASGAASEQCQGKYANDQCLRWNDKNIKYSKTKDISSNFFAHKLNQILAERLGSVGWILGHDIHVQAVALDGMGDRDDSGFNALLYSGECEWKDCSR